MDDAGRHIMVEYISDHERRDSLCNHHGPDSWSDLVDPTLHRLARYRKRLMISGSGFSKLEK